jgi:hypothetical protein
MEPMAATTVTAMGLQPEHYKMVATGARGSRIGFRVRDKKSGNLLRFFYDKRELKCEVRDTANKRSVVDVVDVSSIGGTKTYKESVMERIRTEDPGKSEEQIEYEADLLCEGRKTIEALVKNGVKPELAWKLVKSTLAERIASEEDVKKVINEGKAESVDKSAEKE